MKNKFKKIVAAFAALAIVFTTVVATDVTTAKAATDYETLYSSPDVETGYAGVETKFPFTISNASGNTYFFVTVGAPTGYTVTLYNSAGNVYSAADNPLYISRWDSYWTQDSYGCYYNIDVYSGLPAGDYYYGVTFDKSQYYYLDIIQYSEAATISKSKATVTVGFTKKLSVSGGTVKKWSSSNKKVATVSSAGKVTAKKAGKATITAKLADGSTLKCVVTVKANKYTAKKITVSDVIYGTCGMSAYSASFDSSGNLVIETTFVNNCYYKVVGLKDIRIIVKNANEKVVGTYKASKKSVTVAKGSTKNMSFTIKKADLKKTSANLRNATITCYCTYVYF